MPNVFFHESLDEERRRELIEIAVSTQLHLSFKERGILGRASATPLPRMDYENEYGYVLISDDETAHWLRIGFTWFVIDMRNSFFRVQANIHEPSLVKTDTVIWYWNGRYIFYDDLTEEERKQFRELNESSPLLVN